MAEEFRGEDFSRYLGESRFRNRCRRCNAVIRVGDPCYWRPQGGGVACVPCVTGEQPEGQPSMEIPLGPQGDWYRYVQFLRDSVLVGSASQIVTPEEIVGYSVTDFARALLEEGTKEPVVVGGAGAARIKRRIEEREEGQLSFGWPVLSFTDAVGAQKCAPIFVATVTVKLSQDNEVVLTRESSFELNPAIAASDGIGLAIAERVEDLGQDLSEPIVQSFVTQVANDLDLALDGFTTPAAPIEQYTGNAIFNLATVIAGDSVATSNLLAELEDLIDRTDWMNTAASLLVTAKTGQLPKSTSSLPLVAPLAVNHAQELVLERCGGERLCVITGPPGTGKSQVVVNLVANAWTHDESILVASTNNAAVDVASARANDVAPGLLFRTGNKTAREALPDFITQLVSSTRPVNPVDMSQAEGNMARSMKARQSFFVALEGLAELESFHHEQVQEEERLLQELETFGPVSVPLETLQQTSVKARKFRRVRFLKNLRWKKLAGRSGLPPTLAAINPAIEWLDVRSANIDRGNEIVGRRVEVGDPIQRSNEVEQAWVDASVAMVDTKVRNAIFENKSNFGSLGTASSSYFGTLKAIETVLPFLRGWACTTLSLRQNFSLEAAIFDNVIIDEASQCHLAYILPAAYRAKRLIVVGDPNQLPPIPEITTSQEIAIALRNGILPSDLNSRHMLSGIYSAYDFYANIVGQENVSLLSEHYRSHPHIARWFNETFYGSQLRVLTDISGVSEGTRSMSWIDTPGTATKPAKGSWTNELEAKQVVALIGEFIGTGKSVGVVTPFSAQAGLIQRLARQKYGPEQLGEIRFRSGTAHTFQGDERDVMFFSCVLADGIAERTAKWVQTERRLINVAVSRARETLIVVGNPNISDFQCPTLTSLRTFAQTVSKAPDARVGPRMDSESERRLYDALLDLGLNPISKFNVEGYELDFGLIFGERRYDIEVDGDQHYEATKGNHLQLRRQDITRDQVLTRAGWKVIRIPAWECFSNAQATAEVIAAQIAPTFNN